MGSCDLIAIAASAQLMEQDKYILVSNISGDIVEEFYAPDATTALECKKSYEQEHIDWTKLYVKVKE
jgi:hypothetical protein